MYKMYKYCNALQLVQLKKQIQALTQSRAVSQIRKLEEKLYSQLNFTIHSEFTSIYPA